MVRWLVDKAQGSDFARPKLKLAKRSSPSTKTQLQKHEKRFFCLELFHSSMSLALSMQDMNGFSESPPELWCFLLALIIGGNVTPSSSTMIRSSSLNIRRSNTLQ